MQFNSSRRDFGRWAGAAAFIPWLAACGGGGDSSDDALIRALAREALLTQTVQSFMDTYHLPGALVGVRFGAELPWLRAFGQADLASATPMALASTFPLRSITKSFTVTLLLQEVQAGRMALDDKVSRYHPGVPNGHLISLADLAGNQSGLADYSQQPGFIDIFAKDFAHVWTTQELLAFAFAVEPAFLPGEQYQYSNTNTVLLGVILEKVTQRPLAELLAERIYAPLGLQGTRYPSSPDLPPPAPTPYAVDIATGDAEALPAASPTSLAGSGGMTSTLSDLLLWGEALGTGSLIGASLQAQRKSRSRAVTNGPEYERYGMGIGAIGNWWGHTGSGLGFQVAAMNLASRNVSIAVMVNASPEGEGLTRDFNLAQALFEKLAGVVDGA